MKVARHGGLSPGGSWSDVSIREPACLVCQATAERRDPTEAALVVAAESAGADPDRLRGARAIARRIELSVEKVISGEEIDRLPAEALRGLLAEPGILFARTSRQGRTLRRTWSKPARLRGGGRAWHAPLQQVPRRAACPVLTIRAA